MTDKALLLHWPAACSGPLLAAGAAQAQQAAPAQRPNILFILTDASLRMVNKYGIADRITVTCLPLRVSE